MRFLTRKNKWVILIVNCLARIIFFIPWVIHKFPRKEKDAGDIKKILILELWGIGDVVMMSGVLAPLRKEYPAAKICLLSKPHGKVILSANAIIDQFIAFEFSWTKFEGKYHLWQWDWKGLLRTIKSLRKEGFDLILDARGDIRNNILSFLIRGKRSLGYDFTGGGFLLTDSVQLEKDKRHRVDAWHGLIKHLGVRTEQFGPMIRVPDDEEKRAQDFLQKNGIYPQDLVIGIHPGANAVVRRWPLDRFAAIADRMCQNFSAKIVIFEDQEGYGRDIPIKGNFVKIQGDLRKLIAIIKQLNLLICNDTGVMHIATAVGASVVAIFGPGEYHLIGPYSTNSNIVRIREVPCRPCFDHCKFEKPFCILEVQEKDVYEVVTQTLKKNKG